MRSRPWRRRARCAFCSNVQGDRSERRFRQPVARRRAAPAGAAGPEGGSGTMTLRVFERFTERARQVVVLAQDEARALKHNYIGTEHILLGLLREEEGLAAR